MHVILTYVVLSDAVTIVDLPRMCSWYIKCINTRTGGLQQNMQTANKLVTSSHFFAHCHRVVIFFCCKHYDNTHDLGKISLW